MPYLATFTPPLSAARYILRQHSSTGRIASSLAAHREKNMSDLIFSAVSVGFFALAVVYTHGCEKLRGVEK
jgi:hypothetical protein